MTNNAKKSVADFKKKYKLTEVTEKSICDALDKQGYTVIYFNAILNNGDVGQVIKNLQLEDLISSHKGFSYSSDKYRLVFVNDSLNDEERLMVLAHEEGHIFLGHTASQAVIGQDVRQEHEANEFAHYILHSDKSDKAKSWIKKHKKLVITLLVCVLLVAAGITTYSIISNQNSYYGEYYVTSTGKKYHKKDCIFAKDKSNTIRLTKEEFESGEYEPCKICLPDS